MFYLKNANKKTTSVEAIISFKGKKYKYQTGESVNPDFWMTDKNRAKYNKQYPEGKGINERLKTIKEAIANAKEHFRVQNQKPTASQFRQKTDELRQNKGDEVYLVPYIEKYIAEREMKPETRKKYVTTINKLTDYQKHYRLKISFNDVHIDFYNHFKGWFYSLINPKNGQAYSSNYFGSLIKVIKKIMNHSFENGVHENLKYKHSEFTVTAEPAQGIYLSVDELKQLHTLEITPETVKQLTKDHRPHNLEQKAKAMHRARQRFLIGAFTGLRVSDFNRLDYIHFENGYLKKTTRKTMQPVVVPLHFIVKEIIENGGLDYRISDQKINKQIKSVCQLAGIDSPVTFTRTHAGKVIETTLPKYKLVTTHTARRSAATNMLKAGIGTLSIMKITGHTTERSFMKYIKISQEENARLMKEHSFFKD